ncbi:hypothetical protein [Falsiroseomonas stagni]|uniref:Uncharacterized protein n=1 Tax=Falsiroseomonas stagni DSM 19981 TaxID=1123062 RepID=A0A1I3Z857_9PROT|nr:hypothetical protein [Falsiroseomonas stagni]SFK40255.1 hypothetical protein SAMN02745775_102276 [Falsiroseomonas stagni DSM 19981]
MAGAEEPPPGFAPDFFDSATGGSESPAAALYGFALDLDATARYAPDWVIETAGNRPLRITPLRCAPDGGSVAFESQGVSGVISLSAHPSGWVRVTATIDSKLAFSAFADRIWEEYEVHPPASPQRPRGVAEDAPGRLAHRRNRLSLSARAWPQLQPFANAEGWVLLHQADD